MTKETTRLYEICPRCEEAILKRVEVPYEVMVAGSPMRIPKVQVEECRACGFRSLSGKEVRLFEVLFAPQYAHVSDLVQALKSAGFYGMFMREHRSESCLGFGSREYVAGLGSDLRDLYLDNESSHVIEGLDEGVEAVPLEVAERRYTVKLPKIGEGENGIVYDYAESDRTVLKVAKPRSYSRDHIRQECEITDFFASHGVPVPGIETYDPYGSFVVKERLAGVSLAKLYTSMGPPGTPRHEAAKRAVRSFVDSLLDLFVRHPEAKTSVSPNNIFVIEGGDGCQCLLVDTGPAPFHDYSGFDFEDYWTVVIPKKIEQYRSVGYL
ncbi:MAG TPA: hypothetical protein PLS53_01900 [Thermoanaerobaculaceae bacterium]|nr:hypothetical protein [Thermoanaerobaculaceae bacterium]HPS76889.1 hypothetical protein [Thermoanaerobaculaceae bacterium]